LAAVTHFLRDLRNVPGDLDCDGLVTGYDFPYFEGCMAGPTAQYQEFSWCNAADFPETRDDPDGDVDLQDLYRFQLALGGMGTGACCWPDGTCEENVTVYDCQAEFLAIYNGHGSTCDGLACVMVRYADTIDPVSAWTPSGPGQQVADDITLNGHAHGSYTGYPGQEAFLRGGGIFMALGGRGIGTCRGSRPLRLGRLRRAGWCGGRRRCRSWR
jgi:hypothetical protein